MQYVLVLQFPSFGLHDYDDLIALEELLDAQLPEHLGNIDGHDCGSSEMNVFIHTEQPEQLFEQCRLLIVPQPLGAGLSAAYRKMEGGEYTRVWPAGSTDPFSVS